MKEEALQLGEDAGPRGAREIRASRLTLVDGYGNARATLSVDDDGAPTLRLLDLYEQPRVQLALDATGAANLKLHDREGEVSAWLSVGANGSPSLYLRGISHQRAKPKGHAELCVDEHGCPVLSLYDKDGQPRVLLSLGEKDGTPSLSFSSPRGDLRALLSGDADRGVLLYPAEEEQHDGVPRLPLGPPARREPAWTEAPLLLERPVELPAAARVAIPVEAAPPPVAPPPVAVALVAEPPVAEAPGAKAVVPGAIVPEAVVAEPVVAELPVQAPPAAEPLAPVVPVADDLTVGVAPALPPRLHELAAQPRRRRRSVAVLLVVAGMALGFAGAWFAPRRAELFGLVAGRPLEAPVPVPVEAPRPRPKPPAADVIEAEEFVLKGKDGGTHGRFGLLPDGSPFLTLTGRDGKGGVEVSVLPNQGTLLKLSEGRALVSLRAKEDGSSEVTLHGKGQEARAALFVQPDGTPVVSMTDDQGRVRAGLTISADGSPSLSLYDEQSLRGFFGTSSASSSLMLLNKEGRVVFQAPR